MLSGMETVMIPAFALPFLARRDWRVRGLIGSLGGKSWSGPGFNPKIIILDDGVAFRGAINYGSGETEVEFKMDSDHFAELAIKMMESNRDVAIRAFGQALIGSVD